ncbi:hypothetical protein RvY_12097 [Ramazzottius varieornatus]|uniref:Mediator of RNA polymerase II transcription subunit 13 n=1 Tax=Ramazzottius varieornatus TaxID=947166 RepID=A0A1D1VMK7_RAMVA|nr:hypothetical protein RvY_12097 [Ramazzottius varieornatus]
MAALSSNGASLENCHTNVFALTELHGLQWKRFGDQRGGDAIKETDLLPDAHLRDSVLVSYGKCLNANLLAAWNRVPSNNPANLPVCKKLWIFWYGEEPDLSQLLSPDLSEEENGGWDVGLAYECRLLLFRALHTLIERCLLTHKFVRLGKWFVQPHDVGSSGRNNDELSLRYSYAFDFFLHGESTVCAMVNIKIHPQLVRLTKGHLATAANPPTSGAKFPVILCPYGLAGTLTGKFVSPEKSRELLQQWKLFFPLDLPEVQGGLHHSPGSDPINPNTPGPSSNDPSLGASPAPATPNPGQDRATNLPCFVEVIVSDMRMLYPASFVLLVDDDKTQTTSADDGKKGAAPPLVPEAEEKSGAIKSNTGLTGLDKLRKEFKKKRRNTMIASASKRTGLNGVPDMEADQSRSEMGCAVHSVLRDSSVLKSSKEHPPRIEKSQSMEDITVLKLSGANPSKQFSVQSVVDSSERRSCDCDISKKESSSSDGLSTSQRSFSPTSSPINYSIGGLNQMAMKAKAAAHQDAQSKRDYQSLFELSRPQSSGSFHRRRNAFGDNRSHNQPELHKQNSTRQGIGNSTGGPSDVGLRPPTTPARGRHFASTSVLSPGFYGPNSQPPVTPHSQLGSVLQMSPVSSPGSGVPSPVTPVTPFNPRTPKTPRSVQPRSVNVEREFVVPSPALPGPSQLLTQPPSVKSIDNIPIVLEKGDEEVRVEIGLKRPTLGGMVNDESMDVDENSDVFAIAPSPPTKTDDSDWICLEKRKKKKLEVTRSEQHTVGLREPDKTPKETAQPVQSTASHTIAPKEQDTSRRKLENIMAAGPHIAKAKHAMEAVPGTISAAELSKMFPTPPSIEANQHEEVLIFPSSTAIEPVTTLQVLPANFALPSSSKYAPVHLQEDPESSIHFARIASAALYRPPWVMSLKFQHSVFRRLASPYERSSIRSPNKNSINSLGHRSPRGHHGSPGFASSSSSNLQGGLSEFGAPMRPPVMMRSNSGLNLREMTPGNAMVPQSPLPVAQQMVAGAAGGGRDGLMECQALLVNVMMGDSLMNFFADKNFDECIMCVCGGNVRSVDAGGFFAANPYMMQQDMTYRCQCGFSAVVNRRYGFRAGLFFEDEVDITGIQNFPPEALHPPLHKLLELNNLTVDQEQLVNQIPESLIGLMKDAISNPFLSSSSFHQNELAYKTNRAAIRAVEEASCIHPRWDLVFEDMNRICSGVVELCRLDPQPQNRCLDILPLQGHFQHRPTLHIWHQEGSSIRNTAEAVSVRRMIQPMLQEAVQLRRQTRLWDKVFTVEGPLTWKDFLRFADKEVMEEQKVPLGIPSLVVGYEKEWLRLAPTAYAFWEKMAFEPYGAKRDATYIVLAPEHDFVVQSARTFFRDLSKAYEMCGLGRHIPFPKLIDGLLVVKQSRADNSQSDEVDEWFHTIGDSPLAARLRLYGFTCRSYLGPLITMSEDNGNIAQVFAPPPIVPVKILTESGAAASSPSEVNPASYAGMPASVLTQQLPNYPLDTGYPEKDDTHPLIVVYVMDPFSVSVGPGWEAVHRLASIGLLRSYQEMLKVLPESLRESVVLQIIPLPTILDHKQETEPRGGRSDVLRSLALSVYAQNQRRLPAREPPKMLTGFGPATAFKQWLEERKARDSFAYTPPYVLSLKKDSRKGNDFLDMENRDKSTTLLFAYCLSEDQKFLFVSCTDDVGEILETQLISVAVPNRMRKKGVGVLRYGLKKMWDFILSVVTKLVGPCRLIIGRVGRLGHGELKVWSSILSKKALARAGQTLKQLCLQCNLNGALDMPSILSACLVSLQLESSFTVAVDTFTHDERLPSAAALNPLSSPEDISCTHIYVFPTSARAVAHGLPELHTEGIGGVEDVDLLFGQDDVGAVDAFGAEFDFLGSDFVFDTAQIPSPVEAPKEDLNRPLSPKMNENHGGNKGVEGITDEPGQLLQQPLALGYFVSTAKLGAMPRWFFSSTDQDELACPVVLKAALHIHNANVLQGDDPYHTSNNKATHPLDSSLTADVLKHVLECYNALSWLIMNPGTHDRRSCLPHHIQVLMQLYFTAAALL